MKARIFLSQVIPVLALCVFTPSLPATAADKGIDSSLLAKANAGDAEAQYQLGNAYNYGGKVQQDYAQALLWYRKSAERGNAESEFQLGGLYHFGHGVPQDDAQGFVWIMKAAKQGHIDAEFFISVSYYEGWGVAHDGAQGLVWLRKAAEQGDTRSQFYLGKEYFDGSGVSQSNSDACFWLHLAASGRTEADKRMEARELRDKAASQLTPDELKRVQERVQLWIKDHPTIESE